MILSLRMTTVLGGRAVFTETLGYDSPAVSLGGPSYTGLITRKVETWSVPIGPSDSLSVSRTEDYAYDYAARLSAWDNTTDGEDISYDARGNITSRIPRHGQGATVTLTYTGDRLATRKEGTGAAVPFAHDAFARMTTDAESGLSIAYNALDLPESISQGTTLKARYTYLSDGTKVSALDATGAGLVYRGPFTYRRNPSGTLTFESASFDGGRLTEEGPDFGLPYIDYGARQYSPALSRWLVPDPMGEKYYDVSPYVYCAGNPVEYYDPDGQKIKVSTEYQDQFISDIQNVFGDKAGQFSFSKEGLLQLDCKRVLFTKGLSIEQKHVFKGLYKAMKDNKTTSIVYSDDYTMTIGDKKKSINVVQEYGGGFYSQKDDVIVVAPSVGVINVMVDPRQDPLGGTFREQDVQQNTTSTLFHEIGERNINSSYRGGVIDYENYVRKIIGLPIRPYDLFHSSLIPQIEP